MKKLEEYIIVIGGNGRIGRNFISHSFKETSYSIINIDPCEDSFFSEYLKSNKRYNHIKISLDNDESTSYVKDYFNSISYPFKINAIINLSKVNMINKSDLLINEEELIANVNGQIIGLNKLINSFLEQKHIISGCSIIHAGSLSSKLVNHQPVLYHYLKGGIEVASKSLAFKLAKYNIRSNVIVCGLVNDPSFKLNTKQLNTQNICIPLLSGPPTVQDVSNLILFLISPLSKSITGTSVLIDAGMSLPDTYTMISNLN